MRVLLLPFFIVTLLLRATPTILSLLAKKITLYRLSLVSLLILIFISITLLSLFSTPKEKASTITRKANLIKQKMELESLLTKQPNHRDILLNLSRVNQSLGNNQQATELKNKAKSLDPNSDFLQEN